MNTMTSINHCMADAKPKTSKHLMERKRRARINDSLLQLKSLVFPTVRKEIARHPKLEKADILEMTVRHIQELQKSAVTGNNTTNVSQFHAGFSECLSEVSRFLNNCENIELDTRLRILNHLADKCSTMPEPATTNHPTSSPVNHQPNPVMPVHHRRASVQRHSPYGYQAESRRQLSSVSSHSELRVPPLHNTQNNLVVVIPTETYPSHTVSQKINVDLYPTPPQSPVDDIAPAQLHHYSCIPVSQQQQHNFSAINSTSLSHPGVSSPLSRSVPTAHPVHAEEPVWRPW